jgi:heme oxygenase (mycobilin-producing)
MKVLALVDPSLFSKLAALMWLMSVPAPALALPPSGSSSVASNPERTQPVRPLIIDPLAHPNFQYRIDAFSIPARSRAEFEAATARNRAFIETLPGFLGHAVFEKVSGPSTFDIVTVAAWESPEAIAAAGEKVRAYYKSIGFDMAALIAKWGVTASIGQYQVTPARQ